MIVVYIVLDDVRETVFARRPIECAPKIYQPRLAGMTSLAARARTAAGLWLLGEGLKMSGRSITTLDGLGFAPSGRPELATGPYFSISHSVSLVACALSERYPVGLDVEARRNDISPRLQHAIAPEGNFFDAWCAREATVKATGRVGLARIRQIALQDSIAWLDNRAWRIEPLSLVEGYASCLAYASGPERLADDVRRFDCSDRLSINRVRG